MTKVVGWDYCSRCIQSSNEVQFLFFHSFAETVQFLCSWKLTSVSHNGTHTTSRASTATPWVLTSGHEHRIGYHNRQDRRSGSTQRRGRVLKGMWVRILLGEVGLSRARGAWCFCVGRRLWFRSRRCRRWGIGGMSRRRIVLGFEILG